MRNATRGPGAIVILACAICAGRYGDGGQEGAPARGSAGSSPAESPPAMSYEQVRRWVASYKVAHPGNGGRDWDINAKTPAEIAEDSAARQLLSICGRDQRPVIPLLAWEYGGNDHRWIHPEASPLVYCVYTPVAAPSDHWRYDAVRDHVTADVYVRFPEHNPCRHRRGADQVAGCIGDSTNFEILVDTANVGDGRDVGLSLAEASTELRLILPDGSRVHLIDAS